MVVKIDVAHYDGNVAIKLAFKIKLLGSRTTGQTRHIFSFPLFYVFFPQLGKEVVEQLEITFFWYIKYFPGFEDCLLP